MLYIISKTDLNIKDVVQVSDYQIEENINLNGKSTFKLYRLPSAEKNDFVKFGDFQGIIADIETSKDKDEFTVHVEDVNALFNRRIIISDEALIASTGLEDFIKKMIDDRFRATGDTLLNISYLSVTASTHTPLNFKVDTDDGVFNFRTFLGNMKERYGIELSYTFGSTLAIDVFKSSLSELDIDLTVSDIVDYDEVYAVDVIAKVIVFSKISSTTTNYYLLNNRTVSTDSTNVNRVVGKIESVVVETDEEVAQAALDVFKANSYSHNVAFSLISSSLLYETSQLSINRPLRIKTFDNGIYSTFIAKKKYQFKSTAIEFECGNIKINLIDKLKGVL